jgi:DNA-binding MarR family transcriptional regulator
MGRRAMRANIRFSPFVFHGMFFTFPGMDRNPASPPPLPARFGQQMGIAGQLYAGLIARLLEPHALTWAQFALLLHLARRGGPSRVSEMAAAVELTQSAVTKAVQKFAGLGLVEVGRDSRDARNWPVSITPKGLARLNEVQRAFGPAFAELLDGWSEAELERLIADLARLTARLEAMRRGG